jgi:hypothetical protein
MIKELIRFLKTCSEDSQSSNVIANLSLAAQYSRMDMICVLMSYQKMQPIINFFHGSMPIDYSIMTTRVKATILSLINDHFWKSQT